MPYRGSILAESDIPRAALPILQHALDTYASEINKVWATWSRFSGTEMQFRPHPKSMTVREIMKHELLSERRFFADFLQVPEPPAGDVLPSLDTPDSFGARLAELARPRLRFLAAQTEPWWLTRTQFFDVERERIWIFWRRVLHTAHHRTQLTVYLRWLEKPVPAIYGPTADETWTGADPTVTVEAAGRSATSPPAGADSSPERRGTKSPGDSSR